MNIVSLITDGFGRNGGIALYNRYLLSCLCEISDVNDVYAFSVLAPDGNEKVDMPSNLHYFFGSKPGKIAYCLLLIRKLFKLRKRFVLVCGHINLLPIAALIAKLFKAPMVLIAHGTEVWEQPSGWMGDWMWRVTNKVICVSEFTRDKLLAWAALTNEQVIVIHNAIDLTEFKPGPKPEYLLERYKLHGKKVILTVGRLDPNERAKGFDEIIDLIPKLLQKNTNLMYLVVGSGDDLHRLQKKALDKGIEEKVVFTGWIAEKEKADHYRLADAYVMPSRMEGFGYVFVEAMACGIPVVGSKIDGGRYALLNGELGELVDPDNAEEIFAATEQALEKEKLIPKSLTNFSIQRFNDEISKVVLGVAV